MENLAVVQLTMGLMFACLIVLIIMMIILLKRIADALPLIFKAPSAMPASVQAPVIQAQNAVDAAAAYEEDMSELLAVIAAVIEEEEAASSPTIRDYQG